MFTPMEEHEMHAPKRYLHFVEDSRVRVFTCAGASGCPAANWAVLKAGQGQDAAAALAFAQAQFAQAGALPLVVWAPDALPLSACEAVLSESGYTRFMQTTAPSFSLQAPCRARRASFWPRAARACPEGQSF